MATYYLKSITSDLAGGTSFSNEISSTAVTAGSLSVTITNATTETSYGFTKPHKPSNAAWQTGAITVKVNVTTANASAFLSVQADRINSAGAVQESSSVATEQALSTTGVKTFTISSMTWTSGACGDRIRIRYLFRSSQTHGVNIIVVIETGTTNTEVTPTNMTEHTGTCYGTYVTNPDQFTAGHTIKIATGGSTTDGISTNVYLDSLISSWDPGDKLTLKVENELVATTFDNVANKTQAIDLWYDPENPHVRRAHTAVYDPTRKRMLIFGGWNGTTRYNDVWELTLDDIASPRPQWRQLAPTGTPPSARNAHVGFFDNTLNRMIIGFGSTGSDNNDLYSLSFSGSRDGAWTTLSPTGTVPAVRSQTSMCNDPTNKKAYLVAGWGAARLNDVQELDYSTTNCTWTQKSADGAGGAMSRRSDVACIWDNTNSRIIMFGGEDGTNWLNDTWQYVPGTNTWTDKTAVFSGTAPSVRTLMFYTLDTTNNRMVIFGGRNGTAASNVRTDYAYLTITAGSETWNVITPIAGEMAYGAWTNAGCYDPLHKLFICFGGLDSSLEHQRNILAIDCSNSSTLTMGQIVLNQYLRGRDASGYAYNSTRDETLIVGGFARVDPTDSTFVNGDHTNDMWIFKHATSEWIPAIRGRTWIPFTNREGATVIYDTNRSRFIIFGGLTANQTSNNTYFNDTWELTADANGLYTLTKLAPSGTKPSARWLHAAGYDATNNRMIIFGGDAGGSYLNDTYALSFSGGADGAWSTLSPTGTPPSGRRQASYAMDTGANEFMISHGGTTVSSFAGDTFKLTLTSGSEAWSGITGTGAPTSRRGMTATYKASDDSFYFFGGYNGTVHYNDSYKLTFGGTPAWSTLSPTGTVPEIRRSHVAGYSPTSDKMMIALGRSDLADTFDSRANTYEMAIATPVWAKLDPKIYIEGSTVATGLTNGGNYHWQTWVTGTSGLDSAKSSYGGNAESAADYVIGAGAPTPSVFDSVTITEGIQVSLSLPSPIIQSITVTEGIQVSLSLPSPIFDSITITENIGFVFVSQASIFDSVTISESIQVSLSLPSPIFDQITISENVYTLITVLVPIVFDSTVVTENVQVVVIEILSTFDSVTITENITAQIVTAGTQISVFDSVTVTENTQSILVSTPITLDSVTVTENVSLGLISYINTFDTATITENFQATLISTVIPLSVFDSITVSETVTNTTILLIIKGGEKWGMRVI